MNFDLVEVVAAFIVKDRKLYVAKRGKNSIDANKWELPGGKLKEGEKYDEALKRECMEELGINVNVIEELGSVEVESNSYVLGMTFFLSECDISKIQLKEHIDSGFYTYNEFINLELCYSDKVFGQQYKDKILKYID